MISHALIAAHDYTQVRAALVRILGGNAVAALVLTRIHWRLERSPEGTWWRCNAEQLADETGLSVDQVNRAVNWLRDPKRGHLETTQEFAHGPRDRTLSYRIVWSDAPGIAQTAESRSTMTGAAPVTAETAQTAESRDVDAAESRHMSTANSRHVPVLIDIEEQETKPDDARVRAREADGQLVFAGTPPPGPAPVTAQTIIGEWIDHCAHPPPARVRGQMAREIRLLLEEGIDPDAVRRGVADWMTRDVHPGVLPSIVNNLMNGRRPRSTARAKVAGIMALADEMEARERAAENAEKRGITS